MKSGTIFKVDGIAADGSVHVLVLSEQVFLTVGGRVVGGDAYSSLMESFIEEGRASEVEHDGNH